MLVDVTPLGRDRQGGRAPPRRDRDHRQQERDPVRPAARRTPRRASGSARRPRRRAASAPDEMRDDRPDHHRGDPRARRRRPPRRASPARSREIVGRFPVPGLPDVTRVDVTLHPRTSRAIALRRSIVVGVRRRGAARARPDAARPPDRRSATTSSTARTPAGSTRRRSRAAAGIAVAAAFLVVAIGRSSLAQRARLGSSPIAAARSSRRSSSALLARRRRRRPRIGVLDDLLRPARPLAARSASSRWRCVAVALGHHASTSSTTRSAPGLIRVRRRRSRSAFTVVLDRRDDQQHQLHRRARRPVDRASRSSPR